MENNIKRFFEISKEIASKNGGHIPMKPYPAQDELLMKLTDEEWNSISRQMGPYPYKSWVGNRRRELLSTKEH